MTYDIRVIILEVATIEAIAILIAATLWNWFDGRGRRRLARHLESWRNRQKT